MTTTHKLRHDLPPLPHRMRSRPIDERGYPVPYFVATINGKPDHRVVEPRARNECLLRGRCWVCGWPLGAFKSFVVGPMCAVNRVTAEPASHLECARYAVQACPFLARPHAKRRTAGLPDEPLRQPPGVHLTRNPGVALIWTTRTFRLFRAHRGILIEMGEAESNEWYAEGRAASYSEVTESIATGLPTLLEVAQQDGPHAVKDVNERVERLLRQIEAQHVTA